jgi:hypothetical protein
MDKLYQTGQRLGRVFNSRSGGLRALHLLFSKAIQPNLKLKTWPKELQGSLQLDILILE